MKDVFDQTVIFSKKELAILVTGHDASGILSAMLQHGQPVIQGLVDLRVTHNTNNSAHKLPCQEVSCN
jgi:hypothetical protein